MSQSIFTRHHSHPSGLSSEEAESLLKKYGPNTLREAKKKPLILVFLEEFKDLMVLILIGATILAFLSGETTDAVIILIVVLLNAAIGFMQEYKAEKAIEALKRMIKPFARVLRDGIQKSIPAEQLVPGDILILNEGDSIGADAILFETNELETQEAILTGESMPVEKNVEGMIYMGTMSTHGTGKAIVLQTGMDTKMGKIAVLTTETRKDKSPLEKELDKIGIFVGKITLVLSAILVVFGLFIQKRGIIETLIFATSVAVAAVPEGLPATITIALAIGVQKLAKNNAIVKQLSSVETLGATTVICTDKTGTLTKNEMMVKEIGFDGHRATISGNGYEPYGTFHIECEGARCISTGKLQIGNEEAENLTDNKKLASESPAIYSQLRMFMLTAGLCNNAEIHEEKKQYKVVGDPTEGALITLVEKSGFSLKDFRKEYRKIHEFPFDSTRKRMTIIVEEKATKKIFALSKGAPVSILHACGSILKNNGLKTFTPADYTSINSHNQEMAKKAYRCLALAFRELTAEEAGAIVPGQKFPLKKEQIESGLNYIGILGMIDPPRPEVPAAIELCRKAGIRIFIVTGDFGLTAAAIARQVGLVKDEKHRIIHGDELENIGDPELKKLLADRKLQIIFARVTPEDKLRIVTLLKDLGEVVAVTGDGVNDAPALKKADIGVAMGISGTDVSREAANMVLSDDSFSSIVLAVREGRTIYENLRKFIFYVFSSNIGEIVLIFFAILLGLPAPLSAVLILFVNLTTDVFPAVALGVEPTEKEVMNRKPRSPSAKILDRHFVRRILFNGAVIGTIAFLGFFWEMWRFGLLWKPLDPATSSGYVIATSLSFLLMVTIELANALNARSEEKSILKLPAFSNPPLLAALLISLLFAVIIIEVPYFEKYFHTTTTGPTEWLIVLFSCVFVIAAEETRKLLRRKKIKKAAANHA